jgi:glyoxalase family protein
MDSEKFDQGILGIRHVTAIARDPQKNIDFYTGILGLRLVKITVNFDDSIISAGVFVGDNPGNISNTIRVHISYSQLGSI